MENRLLTVAQYARLEKVSRQAIYQRMRNKVWKEEHCKDVDGQLYIDLQSFSELEQKEKLTDDNTDRQIEKLKNKLELLEKENELLRTLIERKDGQIFSLIEGWQEAQRLGTVQRLSEPIEPEQESEEPATQPSQRSGVLQRLRGRLRK